jgi:hypothetical protein
MRCACGDHAWRAINQGFVVLVSTEDEAILDGGGWYACRGRKDYVTVRRNLPRDAGRRPHESIHRRITGAVAGKVVDHINLNTLDNRRGNLRVCTDNENRLNKSARRGKRVPLKGVRSPSPGRFEALITRDKKQYYLGRFSTAEDAHAAYVKASKILHGEFARAQ